MASKSPLLEAISMVDYQFQRMCLPSPQLVLDPVAWHELKCEIGPLCRYPIDRYMKTVGQRAYEVIKVGNTEVIKKSG